MNSIMDSSDFDSSGTINDSKEFKTLLSKQGAVLKDLDTSCDATEIAEFDPFGNTDTSIVTNTSKKKEINNIQLKPSGSVLKREKPRGYSLLWKLKRNSSQSSKSVRFSSPVQGSRFEYSDLGSRSFDYTEYGNDRHKQQSSYSNDLNDIFRNVPLLEAVTSTPNHDKPSKFNMEPLVTLPSKNIILEDKDTATTPNSDVSSFYSTFASNETTPEKFQYRKRTEGQVLFDISEEMNSFSNLKIPMAENKKALSNPELDIYSHEEDETFQSYKTVKDHYSVSSKENSNCSKYILQRADLKYSDFDESTTAVGSTTVGESSFYEFENEFEFEKGKEYDSKSLSFTTCSPIPVDTYLESQLSRVLSISDKAYSAEVPDKKSAVAAGSRLTGLEYSDSPDILDDDSGCNVAEHNTNNTRTNSKIKIIAPPVVVKDCNNNNNTKNNVLESGLGPSKIPQAILKKHKLPPNITRSRNKSNGSRNEKMDKKMAWFSSPIRKHLIMTDDDISLKIEPLAQSSITESLKSLSFRSDLKKGFDKSEGVTVDILKLLSEIVGEKVERNDNDVSEKMKLEQIHQLAIDVNLRVSQFKSQIKIMKEEINKNNLKEEIKDEEISKLTKQIIELQKQIDIKELQNLEEKNKNEFNSNKLKAIEKHYEEIKIESHKNQICLEDIMVLMDAKNFEDTTNAVFQMSQDNHVLLGNIDTLGLRKSILEKENGNLKTQIQGIKQDVISMKDESNNEKNKILELEMKSNELLLSHDMLNSTIRKYEHENKELRSKIVDTKIENDERIKLLEQTIEDKDKIQKEMGYKNSQVVEEINKELISLKQVSEEEEQTRKGLESKLIEVETSYTQLAKKLQDKTSQMRQYETDAIDAKNKKIQSITEELEISNSKAEGLINENNGLKKYIELIISDFNSLVGYQEQIKIMFEEKNRHIYISEIEYKSLSILVLRNIKGIMKRIDRYTDLNFKENYKHISELIDKLEQGGSVDICEILTSDFQAIMRYMDKNRKNCNWVQTVEDKFKRERERRIEENASAQKRLSELEEENERLERLHAYA